MAQLRKSLEGQALAVSSDMEMNDVSDTEVLQDFVYKNGSLERLEDIIDEFNVFSALNITNAELRHSDFLAWLMDPQESHGLGDYFLSSFLKTVSMKPNSVGKDRPSVFDIHTWDFDDAEVRREWRNIDIVIISDANKFVCVIENKIHSKESNQQLQRYRETVDNEFPNHSKLFGYLTVEEDEPSDEEYIPLNYSDLLPIH